MQKHRVVLAFFAALLPLLMEARPAAAGSGDVLVVGAGVSGLKAAVDLAAKVTDTLVGTHDPAACSVRPPG
jgi:glycerol-3-phosphate dehydrogenase